ncbi:hypothetical protein BDN67DRAFT_964976 [Paxillus ammoniavirescens]|nr:hypothetical protein BDN67DRAFT_964976 [Paxillus ammoniavirescens]
MARTAPPSSSPPKNIVVFGESGAGKSSLINVIAGRSTAATSSRAIGCTFEHRKHDVEVHGKRYAIWDTAGLDEGSHGRVPAERAEENLKQLLRELIKADGIDLLIYCVRGSRLRKALLNNYNLFYSAICRKKVPIALVVTGLENYEGEMEGWWAANVAEFATFNMHFDAHACVTTLDAQRVNSPVLKQRCLESRQTILSMIANTCSRDHWKTRQGTWLAAALADVKATISPGRRSSPPPAPNVAIYELPERPPMQIGSPKDKSPFEGRLMKIGGSPFNVYRIRDQQLQAGQRFKKNISPRGADLLIFCASVGADPQESRRRLAPFYESYGGETRPVAIVVKGAETDRAAREWWSKCNKGPEEMQAIINALPPLTSSHANHAVMKLRNLIQTRSLQPITVADVGCFGWLLGRKTPQNLQPGSPHSVLDNNALTTSNVWTPWR